RLLTWGHDEQLALWTTSGKLLSLMEHEGGVDYATQIYDGRFVSINATSYNKGRSIKLWDNIGNLVSTLIADYNAFGHQTRIKKWAQKFELNFERIQINKETFRYVKF